VRERLQGYLIFVVVNAVREFVGSSTQLFASITLFVVLSPA
jgi:hypothetical protein